MGTPECAITRCSNLERKLVRLSVAIEDKSESIDLLIQAIQELETSTQSQHQHRSAECRLQYDEASTRYSDELERLRRQCAEAIDRKKNLASELEEAGGRKKREEDKLSLRFHEIRTKMEADIANAKIAWDAGRRQREQKWMSEKVNKVRKATLEALQPEVRRLLDGQRRELEEIENERNAKLAYLHAEHDKSLEEKLVDIRSDAESQRAVAVARRKESWVDKLTSMQESHAKQLNTVSLSMEQDEIAKKAEKEYQEMRRALDEEQERSMDKIGAARDKRLSEIKISLQEKEDELKQQSKKQLKDIQENDLKEKESWSNQQNNVMQKELDDQITEIKRKLEMERDLAIDKEIRSNQKKETNFEHEFEIKMSHRKRELENEYAAKMECVKEEVTSKQSQLNNSAVVIQELRQSIEVCREQLEMAEKKMSDTQKGIDETRKNGLSRDLSSSVQEEISDDVLEINELHRKQSLARDRLQEATEWNAGFERYVKFAARSSSLYSVTPHSYRF